MPYHVVLLHSWTFLYVCPQALAHDYLQWIKTDWVSDMLENILWKLLLQMLL